MHDNYIIFDIKVKNKFQINEPGYNFDDPSKLGVSFLCSWDTKNEFRDWVEKDIPKFLKYLKRFPLIIGYNLFKFNYVIMSSLLKMTISELQNEIPNRNIDISDLIFNKTKCKISLNVLSEYNLFLKDDFNILSTYELLKNKKLLDIIFYSRRTITSIRELWHKISVGDNIRILGEYNKLKSYYFLPEEIVII